MKRNVIICALAGAALAATAPALAKPGGGGNGHGKGGINASGTAGTSVGHGSGATVGGDISVGSSISTRGSGAGMNAGTSTKGSASVKSGSALDMRGSAAFKGNTQLTGVTSGMTVTDTGGVTVGTVTGITTRGNGSARTVQVRLTDGTVVNLDARSLSLDGNVLTTTSLTDTAKAANRRVNSQGPAHASEQGLTHASPNSVLSQAGVTTLTGLTPGLTVNTAGGTLVGTVQQVVLNRSGAVVGIRVTTDGGGTVFIPAMTLSMNGTTVITAFAPGG